MKKKTKLLILEKYSIFLKNGKYFFDESYTKLSSIIDKSIVQAKDFDNKGMGIKRKIDRVLNHIFIGRELIIKDGDKVFEGNTLLLPSTGYGVKIFSDNKVLTYYHEEKFLTQICNKREQISAILLVPKILEMGNNYIIEERIIPHKFDKEQALIYIIDMYIKFFSNHKVILFKKRIKEKKYTRLYKKFYQRIAISEKEYDSVIQHGDLWLGNIINNDKIYIIDYEEVGEKYFLYDFFKFIYSEAYMIGDFSLLKGYFLGKYDELLTKYFASLNMIYKQDERKKYFLTFLNVFMEDRIRTNNVYIFKKEIDLIKNVLDTIDEYSKI